MDWLGWMRNDLSTHVAVAGVVVYGAVMLALVWWASHHYVRSAASGWRWTTWDAAVERERRSAREVRPAESVEEPAGQLGWRRVS